MYNNPGDAPATTEFAAPDSSGVLLSPLELLRVHEQRRRGRLLRVISLGVLIPVLILIPTALIPTLDKVSLIALILALIGTLAAFLLNQAKQIGAGSFALLFGLSAAVAWEVIAKAQVQHGIDLSDLRLYDLFILPIVVSAVLVGRRGPAVFGGLAVIFTVGSLFILPHTPELQHYWDGHYKDAILGSVYDVIAVPIAIQLLAATAAWLGADSVRRALLEASRADELATANEQIQAQARSLELQRYRLQQGIGQLQAVHTAVARGQWDARANIAEGELLPVALSLNLLLDRISRMSREADQRTRVDAASHELAIALRRLRAGGPYTPPNYTGTPFDEVLVELARLRSIPPPTTVRTTGFNLDEASDRQRALPAPASQPERPFPFGPPATHHDPAAHANPPTPAWTIPAELDAALQPGRMSLPPIFTQAQPNPLPPSGPLAPPPDDRPPTPTVPRGTNRVTGPVPVSEDWPDLSVAGPVPERGPASSALPAWLQAQATSAIGTTSATPDVSTPLSASDSIQPVDLPPWLRETESASAEPEPPAGDEDAAAPSTLPPWLQNIE